MTTNGRRREGLNSKWVEAVNHHCHKPQKLQFSNARPNELSALDFFARRKNAHTPRLFPKISKPNGGPLPPAGLCKAGGETERAPRFGIFLQSVKMLTPRACFGKFR